MGYCLCGMMNEQKSFKKKKLLQFWNSTSSTPIDQPNNQHGFIFLLYFKNFFNLLNDLECISDYLTQFETFFHLIGNIFGMKFIYLEYYLADDFMAFICKIEWNWSLRCLVGSVLAYYDVKIRFKPQVRHQNENVKKNIFSVTSFQQISGKNSESKTELEMKSISKICCSESTLNCRSRHLCIKLTHTT